MLDIRQIDSRLSQPGRVVRLRVGDNLNANFGCAFPAEAETIGGTPETSMMRLWEKGPRSLIVSITERPLARLVALTRLPKGKDVWAAVMAFMS